MENFQVKKKRFRPFFYSRWVAFLILMLVILLARGAWSAYGKMVWARDSQAGSNRELLELLDRKRSLEDKVMALKTDRGVEAEIRGNFSVAKDGEKVIVVIDSTATEATTTPQPWWRKLLGN